MQPGTKTSAAGSRSTPTASPSASATAPGLAVMAMCNSDPQRAGKPRDWLLHHPPRWYGPNFFETHYFAVRGLYRLRDLRRQSVQPVLRPPGADAPGTRGAGRQSPFPARARGTDRGDGEGIRHQAMAILILNVDRGLLPIDQCSARAGSENAAEH